MKSGRRPTCWIPHDPRPAGAGTGSPGRREATTMTTARTVPVTVEMDGDELDAEDAWRLAGRSGCAGSSWTPSSASATATASARVAPWPCRPPGGGAVPARPDRPRLRHRRGAARQGGREDHPDGLPGGGASDALAKPSRVPAAASAPVSWPSASGSARAALDDRGDGPGGARREPDPRHPARPAGGGEVRSAPRCSRWSWRPRLASASCSSSPAAPSRTRWRPATAVGPRCWASGSPRWPAGTALLVFAIAVLLDHAPRRRQPALSWLALGSGHPPRCSTILATGGLAGDVRRQLVVRQHDGPGRDRGPAVWSLLSRSRSRRRRGVRAARGAAHRAHRAAYDDPGRSHGHLTDEDLDTEPRLATVADGRRRLDRRYAARRAVSVGHPDQFVAEELADLLPGGGRPRVGEGRNATWLARRGWGGRPQSTSPASASTRAASWPATLRVHWVCADVTTWRDPAATTWCCWPTCSCRRGAARRVRHAFEALRDGGTFLLGGRRLDQPGRRAPAGRGPGRADDGRGRAGRPRRRALRRDPGRARRPHRRGLGTATSPAASPWDLLCRLVRRRLSAPRRQPRGQGRRGPGVRLVGLVGGGRLVAVHAGVLRGLRLAQLLDQAEAEHATAATSSRKTANAVQPALTSSGFGLLSTS